MAYIQKINPLSGKFDLVSDISGGSASYLDDLLDVDVGDKSNGDSLVWSSASGAWTAQTISGGSASIAMDDLTDVISPTPSKNEVLIYNGSDWVNAAQGTSFTFSINTFTNDIGSTTVEIGTGMWQASGAVNFSATYTNGPATNGYVSHTGWSNLTMSGASFIGPTPSEAKVDYPALVAGTKAFTLNATDGVDNDAETDTFTFINRRYWGVSVTASSYTEADVEGLANNELSNSGSKTFTVTAAAGEYIIWASRKALGTRTFTVGGFEGGFESPETVSITNTSNFTEDYYVYRSTNSGLGSTTVVVS